MKLSVLNSRWYYFTQSLTLSLNIFVFNFTESKVIIDICLHFFGFTFQQAGKVILKNPCVFLKFDSKLLYDIIHFLLRNPCFH